MASGEEKTLQLVSTIGFNGNVRGGLLVHPLGEHLVYTLGCSLVVKEISSKKQTFLSGHTNSVSCLTCSRMGTYLASGQVTHMGFKADIIIWNFAERSIHCRLNLHKVKVEAVAFSPNDKYLASLGGRDDNCLVLWDIEKKEAVCGSQACVKSAGPVHALGFCCNRDDVLVTGGDHTLRVWQINPVSRKLEATDCNLGPLKRVVTSLQVDQDDQFVLCGTTTGDILQVNISTHNLRCFGPQKGKFSQGVSTMQLLPSGNVLLGAGDGTVAELQLASLKDSLTFKIVRKASVEGSVTSVSLRGHGNQFVVGSSKAQMYQFMFESFKSTLLNACHASAITDICFPKDSSELFATSSTNDVRVWHAETGKELFRIMIPNLVCNALTITPDGHAMITAWDDGKIRAFYPESGRPMYTIHDAHNKGVTALACTSNSRRLVTGGGEGQVRVWDVTSRGQDIKRALKEHKGAITCIKLRRNDLECVSASNDGTCIIWDLVNFVRSQVIFANTMFKAVCYNPEECQVITGGTDRKVGYWETYDGGQIRELEGSKTESINGMDLHGRYFVTGGGDKLVKVWHYDDGEVVYEGVGHSGEITRIRIAPNGQHIVSVSSDGAILRWKFPSPPPAPAPTATPRSGKNTACSSVGAKTNTPALPSSSRDTQSRNVAIKA